MECKQNSSIVNNNLQEGTGTLKVLSILRASLSMRITESILSVILVTSRYMRINFSHWVIQLMQQVSVKFDSHELRWKWALIPTLIVDTCIYSNEYNLLVQWKALTNLKEYSCDFNIFLCHELHDINLKSLLPKFQLIPNLCFLIMHDYVYFIAPADYCVE